jgi:polysaccharide deacetylase 2 family uncharacterized protein YibQ
VGIVRKRKKRGRAVLILFSVVCLCSLLIVLLHIQERNRFRNVLLQIRNSFPVETGKEGYTVRLGKGQDLDNSLMALEEIVSRNNGIIAGYELKRKKGLIIAFFRIEDSRGMMPGFGLSVIKRADAGPGNRGPGDWSPPAKARLCIIIDDAGYANETLEYFLRLPLKMGIAVLPFLERSGETARRVSEAGKEVLLHAPMEPRDFASRKIPLFSREILNSMTGEQVRKELEDMLSGLGTVLGVNNHQGSSATENEATMTRVLTFLKARGLFFIDSLTSPASVTEKVARRLNLGYGKRDIFLDNRNDERYIRGQMEKLIRAALRKGKAIGIGHVNHLNTARVLAEFIPVFRKKGVQVVFPSEIIDRNRDKEVSDHVKENILFLN